MSDLSLLWTLVTIVGSVFASVAGAAWWLKGQLTSAELAGLREQNAALREQNAAHTVWRGFAEAQAKQLAEQLAEAKATNATLQKQIAEGANKEVLANTAASSSRAIGAAGMTIEKFVDGFEAVRLPARPTWETYHLPPIGSPEPPSKGSLLDEPPKGVLD
jgi:hypothetical protein